jgi:RHS repeat-associated protein
MGSCKCLATFLVGVWLSSLGFPAPGHAIDLTYQGTSISVNVSGLGSAVLVYSGSTYFDIETDGMIDGTPIGATGTLGLSVQVTDTDGWRVDPNDRDIHVPQAGVYLYYNPWLESGGYYDSVGIGYGDAKINGTIAGATTYTLTYERPLYAHATIYVWYGDTRGYDFDVYFRLRDSFWSNLSWNLDSLGGPDDNEDTVFDGGGAGTCSSQGLPTYWVNTSFLNLVLEDTDLAYQSFGHRVALRRVWNMLPSRSGMFGNGWTFAYESSLTAQAYTAGGARATLGSGQTLDYTVSSSQGTGTITVNYVAANPGRHPILTGYINQATGTGYYLLYDKVRKLTSRYDYVQTASDGYRYRLTSITDRNGNALTLTYGGDGRLSTLADASNRQTTFHYDGSGHCTDFAVFNGQSASFAYDTSGNLTQSTDLAGNVTTYAYDSQNYPTSMTTAGKTTTFGYATGDTGQVVASVTNALGKTTGYAFGAVATRVTSPLGGVWTYANVKGRTTTATNPLGQTTSTDYNDNGLPILVRDADGRQTALAYDADGNLTTITDPAGKQTAIAYDAKANPVSLTDALGQTWALAYDSHDNLVRTTSPLGSMTNFVIGAHGLVTRVSLPDGAAFDYGYDAHGNVSAIVNPLGYAVSLAYDAAGLNLTSRTDPRNNTTAFQYDANRRLSTVVQPDAGTVQYGYDCCALSSFTDGDGHTTSLERDAGLHITKVTDALGRFTRLAYDNDGFLATSTDPLGRSLGLGRDMAHRLVATTNPLGKQVRFALNPSGTPSAVTNERGKSFSITYDARGLFSDLTDPLGHDTGTVVRDDLGRVSSVTSVVNTSYPPFPPPVPVTRVVSYLYDADGRLVTKKYGSDTVASFAWTVNGQLQSVSDASGTRTFTRDRAGRITRIAYGDGKSLDFGYDTAGNVTAMTYPGGLTVSTTYDSRNRPVGVAFSRQSLLLAYDGADRLAGETRSNGVASLYGHDAAGRLVSLSHKKGATVIADLVYIRDAAGQITEEKGTWPLAPRPAGKSATITYDNADRITNAGGNTYYYDTAGNLRTIRGGATFDAVYDNENRPTSLTLGGKTRTYAYDGLGNRFRVQVGSTVRNLHHDHRGRVVFETDDAGQVTVAYVYAGDRLVASGTVAGGFQFHHQDKTGNTLALTNASGTLTGAYSYAPYGARANHSGTAATSFTYAGAYGVMDEDDGLYFMRNRYYDATTGRFIQRDPIGLAGGFNLYRYVDDQPVSRIDPLGLWGDDVGSGTENWNAAVRKMDTDDKIVMGALGGAAMWWNIVIGISTWELLGWGAAEAGPAAMAEVGGAAGASSGTASCVLGTAGDAATLAETAAERELFRNSLLPAVNNASPVANEFLWNTFRNNIPQIARGILSRGTRW